jgi:hypothetical protein
MKKCTNCKIEKSLSEFGNKKSSKDGLYHWCRECVKVNNSERRKLKEHGTKWKVSLYNKGLKFCNKCSTVKEFKEFNKNGETITGLYAYCRECKHNIDSDYRKELKDNGVYKDRKKEEYIKHYKRYREYGLMYNREKRDYKSEYQTTLALRERKPLNKLKNVLRNRILVAMKYRGYRKNHKTEKILGGKWEIVKEHIESQFTNGMSWNNHGEWHIDHIIPLESATNDIELLKLNHYTNLQPLWATTREIGGIIYEGNLNKGTN